ncbi:glycosyltransferase [Pseudodesulfovibrio sp. zrk46]|uniref:glycosyltransferase family A protein n=1 Tax=Pseudodesulfovibrio sp. zrk46 TaxID=2725288 RepID=UPI001449E1E1|nr:glycosyltransferase [Pseudodesulfovibrio sp. zrk46]QJB57153.1 glycosyltransferase family 2 protein [Pseudodesulfovibrio sp. zrk46]
MNPSFDLVTLPEDLQRRLLLGFSGRPHLHASAALALTYSSSPGDVFSHIAQDALLTAWGENPLDGNCAAALAGSMEKLPPVSPELLPIIKSLLMHWRPEVTPEAQAAMEQGPKEQLAYLMERMRGEQGNAFWLHQIYEHCRINGSWRPLMRVVEGMPSSEQEAPLYRYVIANCLFGQGEFERAADLYASCSLALPTVLMREAAGRARIHDSESAAKLLRSCAEARPWNVNLWLRLFDLVNERDIRLEQPQGRTMVLGYSWNKADDLAETLDSLVRSDLGDVHVRILDNGSQDRTPEVIRQFIDKFGSDRAAAVTMPVNVGAPAARNWLKALPETQAADYVAYIDDDISLPEDWLSRLGAATEFYPDAGVWGCKVVNYDGPARMQCGEHNMTPDGEERQQVLMSTIMLQDGDFGQSDYIRPCTSVTGCVHLFRTDRLMENGDFDLRFSPTQYDDLERDLRMVLGGGHAVYTGHLAIRHKRKSGAASDAGKPESVGAAANMHKLMTKYTAQEFEAMASVMDKVLLADYLSKRDALK